ncbi:MAG: hypothetical protein LPK85_13980, partial [Gammaproteobacteria bacterium]|nr:hypothetical protein [Gammaproteobacteria bacterium]
MHPDISPRPYRSLTRRLLFWVLSISAFNALIAISVQLFMDYRRDLADLSDTLEVIRDSQIESIAAAAWNFDQNLLNVQMQGLVRSPWIGGAQVRYGAHEQAVVVAGDINRESEAQMEYPLEFDTGQRRIRVGRLIVEPNQQLILQRTLDRAVVVSLTQGFKTLAFSMIFLLLMRYLVTRHLRRMAVAVQHVEPGDDAPPLVLHRRPREPDDELTTLADALNRSYRRL